MNYYKTVQPNTRNYVLIQLGLHTALRISDILNLQWETVYDFEQKCFRKHLHILEHKTGKENIIALNHHVTDALKQHFLEQAPQCTDYIFTRTTDKTSPLSRSQAFRIIKKAAASSTHSPNISCHSLRKTFGYHAWKQGTPPALLMDIYNHSAYAVTKRYLGINQDERDSLFLQIHL